MTNTTLSHQIAEVTRLTVTEAEQSMLLEALVDRRGIVSILARLSEICFLKEDHVHEHWQDPILAHRWHKIGFALDKIDTGDL